MNKLRVTVVTLLTISLAFFFSNCSDDDKETFDPAAQFEKEVDEIDSYLESNNIPHIKDLSGVRIVPTSLGTKLPAQLNSTVDVDYKGSLFSSGAVFEESKATGTLNGFIAGWQIALRKLPVGSQATLYIPSYYGYGNVATSKIPASSTLVFEVKVNSSSQGAVFREKFTSDTTAINNYVASKGLSVVKDATGIRYINQLEGTGATPSWFNKVTLKHSFLLLTDDSKVVGTYDRKPSDTFSSFVVDYIPGIQIALMKMKVGGKMRVIIPSGLAFGIDNAVDGSTVIVPANSNIIVDLELQEVN
jgi:FKBP-type peptidyl-prolyl cis-trans isomerase